MREAISRRSIIAVAGTVSTTGIVGCLGGEEKPNTGESTDSEEVDDQSGEASDEAEENGENKEAKPPAQPLMEAESVEPDDANTTLSIRWNGTVFDAVTFPDEDQFWESPEDEQYLILQLAIENIGDNSAEFVPGELHITADGTKQDGLC